MSKTIKIIDLLNKIANGEDVPKKIKFRDDIYEFDIVVKHYNGVNSQEPLLWQYNGLILTNIAEIIEEEPEIDIQGIKEVGIEDIANIDGYALDRIKNKINKLIKAVKKLDNQINNK